MNKQETAVTWLLDNLKGQLNIDEVSNIIAQAKAMEKEQIVGAANNGCKGMCMIDTSRDGEQYYNETYE